MIVRLADAGEINRIANHPAVRPMFDYAARGALDFAECIERPDDYVALWDCGDGCSLFEWSAPGVWEGHTLFLPECRGKAAIRSGCAMVAWMFEHGADMLWGATPTISRATRWFNRRIGFEPAGIGFHHVMGEVERFVMRKPEWSHLSSPPPVLAPRAACLAD